jgi:hypothetical protein
MIVLTAIGTEAMHGFLRLMLCFVAVERPEHKSRKRLEEWLEDGTHHFLGIEAVPLGLKARDNIRGQFKKKIKTIVKLLSLTRFFRRTKANIGTCVSAGQIHLQTTECLR